ncbi:MAG: cob(I)yrinic acid a,c-diamide adenosyltransferase [Flavobacteriaceae bacterium]|jgi:cob(I)alamin adenosyltransferase|nr:cob(I)yrinic acid a,c-diamide adenosyltransferase [Flavobacteriaceae bacterium]
MKIYTKTGDKGKTSLIGGKRVSKADLRIEAYGTIDELNAYIGLLRDQSIDLQTKNNLLSIQNHLFSIGTILALDPENEKFSSDDNPYATLNITIEDINILEKEMDEMNKKLPDLAHFILPGGHPSVSICHICRTICRRTERISVALNEESSVSEKIIIYLNRLSDYFFVLARKLTQDSGVSEIKWEPKNK